MKQNLAGGVEVDNQEALHRLQLDGARDFDLRCSGEARAILVAAVAYRLDMQRAQLLAERVGALLAQQMRHLLDQVGQNFAKHRCGHRA